MHSKPSQAFLGAGAGRSSAALWLPGTVWLRDGSAHYSCIHMVREGLAGMLKLFRLWCIN